MNNFLTFVRDPSRPSGYRPVGVEASAEPTVKKPRVVPGFEWLVAALKQRQQESELRPPARFDRRFRHARASGDAERLHRVFATALVERGTFPPETLIQFNR